MGIPINEPVYGDDCLALFPAGKTPLKVYMTITGIMQGDLWNPGNDAPPNGIVELTQRPDNACIWRNHGGLFDYDWSWNFPFQFFSINWAFNDVDIFIEGEAQGDLYSLNDEILPAGNWFYNGEIYITTNTDADDSNLLSLADLMGIPPGPDTFGKQVPIDANTSMPVISSRRWFTNVLTKWAP